MLTQIETDEQYTWALKHVEELLPYVTDDTPVTDPKSKELELLSHLVADYSDKHFTLGEPSYISGKSEPTLKVAREMSRKLNIDANIVLGV
ncbi:MAG: transcriptional regulator [Muribaculaceae bacterium]